MDQNHIYTTICIKRRVAGDPGPPPSLSSGELAFNENDNTLYIGTTVNNLSGTQPDPGFF